MAGLKQYCTVWVGCGTKTCPICGTSFPKSSRPKLDSVRNMNQRKRSEQKIYLFWLSLWHENDLVWGKQDLTFGFRVPGIR